MKAIRLLASSWVYLCLATMAAEAGLIGVLAMRGILNMHTWENLLIVAYDVPVQEIHEKLQAKARPADKEMVSFAEIQEARLLATLDLELREFAADKGLVDLRAMDARAEVEKGRYAGMKELFDRRWESLHKNAADNELQELRRKIESMQAKQAKDQLLRILDDDKLESDGALQQVVSILRNMPVEKRKKIVAEFKEFELPRIQRILREIRLGRPQSALIRETREQLTALRDEEIQGS